VSATQAFEIVAIVAIAAAAAAGVGLGLVYVRLQRYQRNQHVIMGSRGTVDIVDHVTSLDEKLNNIRTVVEDLTLAARDHEVRIDNCLSRVGIVRFDAYQDLGGRQSTAVAFLNALEDGVIITTVVSRDFARMYVKLVRDGKSDILWQNTNGQAAVWLMSGTTVLSGSGYVGNNPGTAWNVIASTGG